MNKELIEFAVFLTGHDLETIAQMYDDWSSKQKSDVMRCKVCFEPFTDYDDLYNHYDEVHNKG